VCLLYATQIQMIIHKTYVSLAGHNIRIQYQLYLMDNRARTLSQSALSRTYLKFWVKTKFCKMLMKELAEAE